MYNKMVLCVDCQGISLAVFLTWCEIENISILKNILYSYSPGYARSAAGT